jgi:LysM repeat protein
MTEVRLARRTIIMATMTLLVFGAAACTREKPPASEPTPTLVMGAITPLPGTGVAIATVPFTFTEVATAPAESTDGSAEPGPTVFGTATPFVPPGSTTYTIQSGEWLSKVAQRFGVTTQALMAANPGLDPNRVYAGQVIVIPTAGAPVPTPSTPTSSTPAALTPAASITHGPTPSGSFTYTVQREDGLYSIARKFGITVQALQTANPSVLQKPIYPGQVLIIPGGNSSSGQPATNGGSATSYTVKPGDTLYSIAVRFGKTVYEIQTANNLPSVNSIYAGQTLIIP